MTPTVIGMEEARATALLENEGFCVSRQEYVSKRGIPGADSTRVIRQREIDGHSVEITVSHFKTQVDINWA